MINQFIEAGYGVYDKITNLLTRGFPQNRPRYWMIAILTDVRVCEFQWPTRIAHIPLDEFLAANDVENGYLRRRFAAHQPARNVDTAVKEVPKHGWVTYWTVSAHLSDNSARELHPQAHPVLHESAHFRYLDWIQGAEGVTV